MIELRLQDENGNGIALTEADKGGAQLTVFGGSDSVIVRLTRRQVDALAQGAESIADGSLHREPSRGVMGATTYAARIASVMQLPTPEGPRVSVVLNLDVEATPGLVSELNSLWVERDGQVALVAPHEGHNLLD